MNMEVLEMLNKYVEGDFLKIVIDFLEKNPSVAIFICLAFGYLIGKLKYKSFSLGSTVGTLIIGLILGQLGLFKISPIVKNIFFSLFIFTIGYIDLSILIPGISETS